MTQWLGGCQETRHHFPMPTIGQLAAQALLEAKRKGPVSWKQVGEIIDEVHANSGCVGFKPIDESNPTPEWVYLSYPRKQGRTDALRAIKKAVLDVHKRHKLDLPGSLMYLHEKTCLFANATSTWAEKDKCFIPHPATWYNRGNYDDEPKNWKRVDLTTGIPDRTIHAEIINPLKLSQ